MLNTLQMKAFVVHKLQEDISTNLIPEAEKEVNRPLTQKEREELIIFTTIEMLIDLIENNFDLTTSTDKKVEQSARDELESILENLKEKK